MIKPRAAKIEAELVVAAPLVRTGALVVGPIGVAVELDLADDATLVPLESDT